MAINPSNIRQLPPMYDGLTIIVQGTISPSAKRFAINLCAGPNIGSCDNALHINPRYDQNKVVVRNSFIGGNWGAEERGGPPFQIAKGQQLECIMLIQHDVIKVAFNGQHYCEYRHRIPKERITHIVVTGGMQLQNMTFYGPSLPPIGAYGGQPGAPAAGGYPMPGGSYASPVMPYNPQVGSVQMPVGYPPPAYGQVQPITPNIQFIPGGLFPGRLIYITATPGPSKYAVNLRYQQHGGDIAFHFNPRLQQKVVVRNSNFGGSWGAEERDQPSFPFQAGHQFTMIILCEPNEFKVAVNNQHFIQYRVRRANLQAIQWVEVEGDITVSNIFVQ